jgi:hypothetical protein
MSDAQRREFHEALLDADAFENLPGKWQAAVLKTEAARPQGHVPSSGVRAQARHPRLN